MARATGQFLSCLLCGLFFLLVTGVGAVAQPACPAPDDFPNPALLASLRKGVNLPGWDSADVARHPTIRQLQALRQRGFDHVRLPLDNRRLTNADADAYLDQMVEQVVFLLSLDLSVVLDLHPDGTVGNLFERDPAEAQAYLAEMWTHVARRVRFFDPQRLAVELLNEPQTDQSTWHKTATALIGDIRRILPDTTILVGPAGPQRHEPLSQMQPFEDRNIVYALHYYDPFAFTHQGADWGAEDDAIRQLRGLPFPALASDPVMQDKIAALKQAGQDKAAQVLVWSLEAPWTAQSTAAAFDVMRDWSERFAVPLVVGEFGVLTHVAPRQSRLTWLATVRAAAEQRCIGWTHWDFQDGFGLIDPATGMPDEGVMQALVPSGD